LIIWVVGSILGASKDVDMVFTRRFDICHLQVLLMNLNLVPLAVNMVIGDNLYTLKFLVELNLNGSNPQPMEMDSEQDAGKDGRETRQHMGQNTSIDTVRERERASRYGQQGVRKMSLPTFHIHLPMEEGAEQEAELGAAHAVLGVSNVEAMQTMQLGLMAQDESSMQDGQGDRGQSGQGEVRTDMVEMI
jgi:hypothetical protein